MSNQRYSPEFEDEAVRQIIEGGHSTTEVTARLGVSANSLYKWVKAVRPNTDSLKDEALIEAKRENIKLRAELRRVKEERDILKKGRKVLSSKPRVKYRFIEAHREQFRVMVMCRVLQVSRIGYYAWIDRPLSARARDNERLLVLIRASHVASGGIYGALG